MSEFVLLPGEIEDGGETSDFTVHALEGYIQQLSNNGELAARRWTKDVAEKFYSE